MRKIKKTLNILIPTCIFVIYFIIPIIGFQLNGPALYDLNDINTYKIGSSLSSFNPHIITDDIELEDYSEEKNSKFDRYLKEYLANITLVQDNNLKEISIIIHFENSIHKEERINILDSIFYDYDLITNYDIIAGTYLKINPYLLIKEENVIENNIAITKVYKSRVFQYPYLPEDDLHPSVLDENDYSNWRLSAIGAENLPYDGSGVKVAVIDTGIYPHPDLTIVNNSNFVLNESYSNFNDDVGHGTHVAGIIAGDGESSSGKYRGVAPGALLINARAGNSSGLENADIIRAIEWASKPTNEGGAGADIISMSFGGGYPIITDSITDAITNAKNEYGVIFVSSAGNYGPEYYSGSTPASGVDVIAVGATNRNNELASFSSWGPSFGYIGYPDVVAPGVNIISTEAPNSIISDENRYKGDYFDFPGNADYMPLSGTSMSCPIVAGALAILLEAYPNITPETARIALLEGARKLESQNENEILRSGAGIINVTSSLFYLNSISPDYNNTVKLYPDDLPIKPYDLLHFPGDHQKFNLTVISGESKTIDIEIPNDIQGVSLSLDKTTIIFSEAGVDFVELDIRINKEAFPGERNFQINLTVGGENYDSANIDLEIRLPEYKILMESYHGLNDWFPEPFSSFYQIGFYEAMEDLSDLNISIDYNMEYWTPNYNKDLNNSILTEERLAQYDIVFLQAPILPYSPLEINNLVNYFNNGGNVLFLGTRYQDMVVENINYLFSRMGVNIQINEENVMDDNWEGTSINVNSQSITNLDNSRIFKDVDKFYWLYGNSFSIADNSEDIASVDNKTVAAMFNGTSDNKGNFLAFGDLHWIYNKYDSTTYSQDHSCLLKNIIDFFLPTEDVAINIDLNADRVSNPLIDLTIYLTNQSSHFPITTTSLDVIINGSSYSKLIKLNTTYSDKGIYFNNSYNLPYPSYIPFNIEVNLTIGSKNYVKTSKILYFNQNKIPIIGNLTSDLPGNFPSMTRAIGNSTNLIVEMDKPTYGNFEGYLSIYSYSIYNSKASVNKTLTFNYSIPNNDYRNNFDPDSSDPSGFAIYYTIPKNSNYTNPNSPRYTFRIANNPPEIVKDSSTFTLAGYTNIYFDETESDDGSYIYGVTQGDTINFAVNVRDTVNYEDDNSNMRVFVNLLICSVTEDNYIVIINPRTSEVAELTYQSLLDVHEGTFIIPSTMDYSSISGTKSISTATGFNTNTNEGYLGIILVTVYDSEGGFDEFIVIINISEPPMDLSLIIIIVVSVIALVVVVGIIIYYARRKKYPRVSPVQPSYQEYYYRPSFEGPEEESYTTPEPLSQLGQFFCPFCGQRITTPKKFCPHCGESLMFEQQDE